ncbi:MAG: S1 RNA-binding domain-containing protein, partial [Oscillospiraceae bacterium]|nr:S1 RNA-binding domain-containing protein [Oscillospiraceae bacterium]
DILDNTGVHPESYTAAERLLKLCGYSLDDVRKAKVDELISRLDSIEAKRVTEYCGAGMPTIRDIAQELMKPGRDPRDELPPTMLRTDVLDIKDLNPGMIMRGTVRNVVDFGAFVDIGVHQDGLVHISELSDSFVKHPSQVLKVGDIVDTLVLSADPDKKRISLSIRQVKK